MSLQTVKEQKGFTIVELLIVIVVIGILAAITIVAFTGVQNQAKTTKAQAVASDVQKKAEAYNATNGRYPLTSAEFTGIAKLAQGNEIGTPSAGNGQTTVSYTTCPASANANNITGGQVHFWDYTASSPGALTTAGTGGKSITVGSC